MSKENRAGATEPPGAQSQSQKRLNLASNGLIYATQVVDAIRALSALKEERAEAGNFTDAELQAPGSDLQHLTAFMIGSLFDTVVPNLKAAIDDPANKPILMQVRR